MTNYPVTNYPMTNDRIFHLKPFSLSHHESTMKVGTDAMILGLWTDVSNAKTILEVGAGCGIISLLIASRSKAFIDAVELDKASFIEAERNFNRSPYFYRLNIFRADFNEFANQTTKNYDLIISNPPFFINDMRPEDARRKTARHGDLLSFEQLSDKAAKLLSPKGKMSIVLPYDESRLFLKSALENKLHLQKQLLIFPKRGHQPNRANLQLGFDKPENKHTDQFTIREDNGTFTSQYVQFFKDYYIGLG